ncbi:hypothetical protein [Sorangium sp. So ce117]|uniref:hypothetical protein n=1 Tax=Sorangium sp. So ce117 TaxID=3133277 RepID=UPI003F5D7986
MTTKILGINCTSAAVFFAETTNREADFRVLDCNRLNFSLDTVTDMLALEHATRTVLETAKNNGTAKIAILKCFSGPHGSSVEAIKAEGVVELIASQLEIEFMRVAPQSLPSALGCAKGEKWQQKAKDLFNPDKVWKHWAGTDGAVSAAYKAAL